MTARPIPAEVLAATQGARTVVAPTDEGRDDAYRQGRAAAIALCAALKAKLILVDRATESWWIDPYGSGSVTADTDLYSHGERPLDRAEVAALGHGDLVEQMDEAAAAGVEVAAYLGRRPGFRDLKETLERIPVDVVLAVDWLEHPDLGDRFHLRSGFLDRLREVASSRTVVVSFGRRHATGLPALGVILRSILVRLARSSATPGYCGPDARPRPARPAPGTALGRS